MKRSWKSLRISRLKGSTSFDLPRRSKEAIRNGVGHVCGGVRKKKRGSKGKKQIGEGEYKRKQKGKNKNK